VTQDAVCVEGLVKSYGAARAAADLSFTAPAGAVTAVLGPNGAGKTTTIEICEGFRQRDSGLVRVLGEDPGTRAGHAVLTPRVGVMPQTSGAYPGIRAAEMLRLVAGYYAHPLDPDLLLERLGLTGARRTPWRHLSGGQQQRLSLALAIVGRPELVFLDEPTSGLDVQARHASWELIRELRSAGASVVLTTHFMDEAEALADHVVVVDAGHAVAAGSVAELTRGGADGQLRFRATAALDLDQLLSALPVGTRAKESPAGHYLIEGAMDPHLLAAVTAWAASQRTLLEDLRVEQRSLEDVFLELTGKALRG
jgi:ABC-2 type transport system ATP-binding protein